MVQDSNHFYRDLYEIIDGLQNFRPDLDTLTYRPFICTKEFASWKYDYRAARDITNFEFLTIMDANEENDYRLVPSLYKTYVLGTIKGNRPYPIHEDDRETFSEILMNERRRGISEIQSQRIGFSGDQQTLLEASSLYNLLFFDNFQEIRKKRNKVST